jgi:predicted P-loop ATPase/GTPase
MCYAIIRIELTGGNKAVESFDCETEEKFNSKMEHIKTIKEAKTIKVYKLSELHARTIEYTPVSVEQHLAAEKAEAERRLAVRAPLSPGVPLSETDADAVQKIIDDAGRVVEHHDERAV